MANLYLIQHIKGSGLEEYINMREEEVEALRKALFNVQAEAFQYRERIKRLESHLYRIAELVLAGEGNSSEAQDIAQKALTLLFENKK